MSLHQYLYETGQLGADEALALLPRGGHPALWDDDDAEDRRICESALLRRIEEAEEQEPSMTALATVRKRKSRKTGAAPLHPHYARAVRILLQSAGPQYQEDKEGRRIRIWGDPNEDWVKPSDVRQWLTGQRVVDDLRDGLEYVRESYLTTMVREGYLRKDPQAPYYWVTAKAAEKFNLPRVNGAAFPE